MLSVLMAGPATGYDIKKVLEQEVSKIVDVTISNIYPALNELAAEGLVTYERVEQENRPAKKVYAITDAGRSVCLNTLMTVNARHRLRSEFMFLLSFAPYLPRRRIKTLLDERLADLDEVYASLDDIEAAGPAGQGPATPGQAFCVGMGRAMIEAERNYILNNRDWLLRQAPEELPFAELVPG
ncbi:MAG TPA: PadR family transcriptional regulator [Parvibaculum sp.]|uniref:PadR family transcriptional regulator n=1 Tax=Parvibaculum sp. TaxID=2024848 RepID=UPI002BD4984F|nr:PadR family transcriptional regulator [Parvibaculum sp.]HMM14128.1 PadR family transcriptional regulator [Parvibaculum sp.]